MWTVDAQPAGENPGTAGKDYGKSTVGIRIVLLKDGDEQQEVARVRYRRENSSNPDTSFLDQLEREIHSARVAASYLNVLPEPTPAEPARTRRSSPRSKRT